jgi:hypothetical protein
MWFFALCSKILQSVKKTIWMGGSQLLMLMICRALSSTAISALKFEDSFPIAMACFMDWPFLCLKNLPPPAFLPAPSAEPSVKTWVHWVGL